MVKINNDLSENDSIRYLLIGTEFLNYGLRKLYYLGKSKIKINARWYVI